MTTAAEFPIEQRILQLFQHLGIWRAHIASRMPQDWEGFVTTYPERVASLTLVCPRRLVHSTHLRSGEAVLDVGCGPGPVARWLARQTNGANPIVGTDTNRYLLNEAMTLARKEGLADVIAFQEGNAEALPFPSDSFDVTLSSTVLEEGDAKKMLSELVRVTKPAAHGRPGSRPRGTVPDRRRPQRRPPHRVSGLPLLHEVTIQDMSTPQAHELNFLERAFQQVLG